ncbi:MAG: hydrolase, partial [Mycobacterium sp.]
MSRPAPPLSGGAVDWDFAGAVGARLARSGPPTTDYTRAQVIDDLGAASRRAETHVREVTGLSVAGPARDARIIDRQEWIRAAANSLRVMAGGEGSESGTLRGVGVVTGRLAGAQTGAVLAFVSAGILGQFDPFTVDGGDLLLVYPNVIAAERQLRVPPGDFRLWVCLHEVTHRVQFTANPWLSRYMADTLAVVTTGRDDDVLEAACRLAGLLKDRGGKARPGGAGTGSLGVIDV